MNFIQLVGHVIDRTDYTPHGVEIPLIQRDYAQGRGGEAHRTADIRKSFLDALHNALGTHEGAPRPAHLDFIYGEVVAGVFEPIDGQQRLTTLFLLHWYLAAVGGQGDDFRNRLHPICSRNSSVTLLRQH